MINIIQLISVIVAVKNEETYIKKCLDSLINQSFSKEKFNIIVVDGKSTDRTVKIVNKYIKKYPSFIKLYKNPKEWQSAGRNVGIVNEKSELIAYIDGHCIAHKHWLKSLYNSLKASKDSSIAGIGSVHISPEDELAFGKAVEQLFYTPLGGVGSSYRPVEEKQEVITAPFVLYKRKALESVGLYDEDMRYGEDFSLNFKLRKKGFKILVEPSAIVYYYKKKSFSKFFKQMYNYGKAKAIIGKKYPRSLKTIHFMPCCILIGFVLLGILSFYLHPFKLLFLALLILYLLAIGYFSLSSAIKEKKISFVGIMPILFIFEHFAYSLGFISGIFKKGWVK